MNRICYFTTLPVSAASETTLKVRVLTVCASATFAQPASRMSGIPAQDARPRYSEPSSSVVSLRSRPSKGRQLSVNCRRLVMVGFDRKTGLETVEYSTNTRIGLLSTE